MGWASGAGLAEEVWDLVYKHIPKTKRKKVAKAVYDLFCARDADGWDVEYTEGWILHDAGLLAECEKHGAYNTEWEDTCPDCEEDWHDA